MLLVPATLVRPCFSDAATRERRATARKRAERGRALFAKKGLPLHDAKVGAPDPAVAIDNEVQADSGYTGFVISTLPAEKSHWLGLDLPRTVRPKYRLPVHHVVAALPPGWR